MKRLFRPRNLIILAILGAVAFAVVKKKQQDQQLAAMSDDQVREMVHDRVAGKVDAATETEIADKVVEKKDALTSSATAAE
jgi:hypothetical protein